MMAMKKIFSWTILMMSLYTSVAQQPLPANASPAANSLTVSVHPGCELMAVVQILAGKYPSPTPSAYAAEMKRYFEPFAGHAAVQYMKGFKRMFTDFIELGWCFDSFPQVRLTPTTKEGWFRLYGKDSVLHYLELVKQFYFDSQFWKFYQQHENQYSEWAKDVQQKIIDSGSLNKLYGFYRLQKPVRLYIGIEPLNNWGAHAIPNVKQINPRYSNIVAYETGYFNDTATESGTPVFTMGTETIYDLLWHEGSHIMIEDLMQKYAPAIQALSYLYNGTDEGMKRNNISSWEYCLNENIVRSVVACLKRKYRGFRPYEKTISREDASDFIYVNDMAPFIWQEYTQSGKYADFGAFFPVLLNYLDKNH